MPCFAGTWNRGKTPYFLSRFNIESRDESANAIFSTRWPDDDLVLHHQRGQSKGVAGLWPGAFDLDVPNLPPRFHLHRNKTPVQCGHKQLIAVDSQAAIDTPTARSALARRRVGIHPKDPTR